MQVIDTAVHCAHRTP